jgi:anti-sigma-K factor RskA
MTPCPFIDDAAAWVLGALDEAEAGVFAEHLDNCDACQAEAALLQPVVDVLPMAAAQMAPPPELKRRIMAVVESEAQLLRAAGPEADRVVAPRPHLTRWRRFFGAVRPMPAAVLASVLLAVGVVAGLLASGGSTTTVIQGFGPKGAQVALKVDDHRGHLELDRMPAPPAGRVYQVWLVRGEAKPVPTHTLFTVPADGRANVDIMESLKGTDKILVTAEPTGGSVQPTTEPVAGATLT